MVCLLVLVFGVVVFALAVQERELETVTAERNELRAALAAASTLGKEEQHPSSPVHSSSHQELEVGVVCCCAAVTLHRHHQCT